MNDWDLRPIEEKFADMQQDTITAKELFESMVESPPDDTCRTCRFWTKLKNTNKKISDYWGLCSSGDAILRTDSQDCDTFYAYDYGCIFHRPKEAG